MRSIPSWDPNGPITFQVLVGLSFGAWLSISPFAIYGIILVSVVWLVILWVCCTSSDHPLLVLCIQVAIVGGVVVAAYLAPFKQVDRLMLSPVHLPKNEMTLAELYRHSFVKAEEAFPVRVRFPMPRSDLPVIVFPARDLPLRQFTKTIERQSQLEHYIPVHPDGSSILFGRDCHYGVLFNETDADESESVDR